MNELIDRQAAIDGKIVIQRTNGVEIYSDEAVPVEYLKNLPSRQPEPSTNCSEIPNSSDCISRQAAIDALDCINGAEEVLRSLPPAQPEYRLDEWCMDCKEYDQEKHCCPRFNRVIREAAEEVRQNAQPEPQEGHWIPHESPDGGEQYECSECGVLWEFTDGTPEDNEAYFCPRCGAKMRGEQHETD